MSKRLVYGLLLLVAAIAIVGFVATNSYAQSFFKRGSEDATTSGAEAPPVVTAPTAIIVEARVVPNRQADLSLAASGIVAEVLAAEGARVTAGAPLLRLQSARQAAAVAQAEANLRNAESALAQVQAPPRTEEIARSQAAVASAQAALQQVLDGPSEADITAARVDLANAEAELRRAQSDYDKVAWATDVGMMPQATALEQATNHYARAQANLAELEKGADPEAVRQAQAAVSQAQADLNLLMAGATDAEVAAAEANVAAAQAALRAAHIALAEMTLVAPFDGVVAAVNVEVGEQVTPGVAAVRLADLGHWRIETEDLTELRVVDVQVGDPVAILFDALPDDSFTGEVVNIRPIGENKQGDITYTVVVALDEQDPRLRWNMTAQVTIQPDGLAARTPGKAAPAIDVPLDAPMAVTDAAAAPAEAAPIESEEPAPAAPSAPVSTELRVTGTVLTGGATLNVRSGPGANYPVIAGVRSLETLPVAGRNQTASWLLVELPDGRTGWVSADYMVVRGDLETLPLLDSTTNTSASGAIAQPVSLGPAAPAGLSGTLVFQAASGGAIYVYDLAGGVVRPLTNGMDPALSPDGQTVAFVREGGEHGLYLIDITGGHERRIYSGGEQLRAPSWSPDGNWLVFSRRTGEFHCREVGSGLCYPDSDFLDDFTLVSKAETMLSVVDTHGQNFRDLPALNTAVTPSWGHEGIVYAGSTGLELTGDQPGAATRAVAQEIGYQDPDLSGGRIVFHSVEGSHREIFTVNADGSGLQALTRPVDLLAKEYPQNVAPVWSPDGRQIAFLSNRTEAGGVGAWGIWVMDAEGSNLRRLPLQVEIQYNFQGEQVLSWQ